MSRAAVVDWEAFVQGAEQDRYRAATDVFPVEPVPQGDPVRQVDNLLLSAHRTAALRESFFRIGEMAVDDLGTDPERTSAGQNAGGPARNRGFVSQQTGPKLRKKGFIALRGDTVLNTTDRQPTVVEALGFDPRDRVAIFHADDVGMCHGANTAFYKLSRRGVITCGAVMVTCPWFLEVVAMAEKNPGLDIGVHLTLTSEWPMYRWGPISTRSSASGLIDEQGYFWRKLPMLAGQVVPEAAETEMRAQIDRALSAGLDITHLDTHMGAALLPDLLDIYFRLGREYNLPVLLPKNLADYTGVLDFGEASLDGHYKLLAHLETLGWPLVDHFRMTPGVPTEESDQAYRDLVTNLPTGLTFAAFHSHPAGRDRAYHSAPRPLSHR